MRILLRTGCLIAHEALETRRGGRFQMLCRSEVAALAADVRQEVRLAETHRLLGVERDVTKGLVANGLLAAVRRGGEGSPLWAFTRAAVAACLVTLTRSSHPIADDEAAYCTLLQAAVVLGRIRLKGADVLSRVADGTLAAHHIRTRPRTLRDLRFARADIDRERCAFAAARDWLTFKAVQGRLGFGDVRLQHMLNHGLLAPTATIANIRYFARTDVDAFQVRYATTAEAAGLLGVHPLVVQRWATRGRLQAVCGPTIDGCHSYPFERAYLAGWQAERLTFGAARELLGVSKATLDRWTNEGTLVPLADMGGTQRWFARRDVLRLAEARDRLGRRLRAAPPAPHDDAMWSQPHGPLPNAAPT